MNPLPDSSFYLYVISTTPLLAWPVGGDRLRGYKPRSSPTAGNDAYQDDAYVAIATRVVSADEADIRLDRWFRRHYPGLTQGAIQKLCRTGQVRVDGHRADPATRLVAGQSLRIPPLPAAPPAKPVSDIDANTARDLQRLVLHRDDHLLVLNKPHGMPVQGGPGITHHLDALLDALRFGSADRPRLVHRLDRDTSGVLLLARTPGTAAKLAAAFRSRAVEKTYWAVVARRPMPPEGRIDLPLRRIGGARGERTEVADRDDKAAARATSPTTARSTTPGRNWHGWNCPR